MSRPGETRFLFATFSLGHMANDWAPGAVWLIVPAVALDLGLSPAEVGLLLTLHSVGASLAYLPAGMLADHVADRGRLLAATFWWVGIGYFVASFMPGFWTLALMLAAAGLGDAAWHPIATGVLARHWPARRGEALGIHAIGGSLATVLAPLAVGYLLAVVEWRDALRISVAPALVMGVLFIAVARRVPRSVDGRLTRADFREFVAAWWTPAGAGLLAVIVSYQMAVNALMAMTPLFLQVRHGFTPAEAGTLFAAGLLAGALAQPSIGRVSDRVGRRRVFVCGALGGAVISAGIAAAAPGIGLAACIVGAFGLLVGVRASLLALAVDFAAKREGTTLGFVFAIMDGVGALGAVFAGMVAGTGLPNAFLLAGAFAATSVAFAVATPFARVPVVSRARS